MRPYIDPSAADNLVTPVEDRRLTGGDPGLRLLHNDSHRIDINRLNSCGNFLVPVADSTGSVEGSFRWRNNPIDFIDEEFGDRQVLLLPDNNSLPGSIDPHHKERLRPGDPQIV